MSSTEKQSASNKSEVPEIGKWLPGDGAVTSEWKGKKMIEVDPNDANRNPFDTYRLLVAAVAPRPIGFLSTVSKDGVKNLAPFSYFNVFGNDPVIFCVSFASRFRKDTPLSLNETGECTINIVSEWFVEAANLASVDCPADVDEWKLTGLTPVQSKLVKAPRVGESAFSIEAKVLEKKEYHSRNTGDKTAELFILEGILIHAREDVVNKEVNDVDLDKLKPVGRLGGAKYARIPSTFELPRPIFADKKNEEPFKKLL